MAIGYLASQYPAASHTFIRREVEALRKRGIPIETFSVRRPSSAETSDPSDRSAFESTGYILPAQALDVLAAHAAALGKRPGRYARTLLAALRHRVPGTRALLWSLFYFAEAIVLARELEQKNVRHLHNHFANPGANVGYLASRFLEIGWSLTLHGISEFDYPAGLLLPEKIAAAEFAACVSHFGRAQAFRSIDAGHWSKLFLVRCGVDVSKFSPGGERRSGRLRVVTVGRLSAEKGQLGLLEAFARVVAGGADAELRIVGDGPLKDELERKIAELGLGERVVLVGRLSETEVVGELVDADVFALSSFMEGLPVVLMEALAMQLGVVAPCVAGIPELVQHDKTGLLFAPGDWNDLARALERLLTDRELRLRLGRAGRQHVEAEFDVEKAVEPLARRFGELA